jgi:hypothetical protein
MGYGLRGQVKELRRDFDPGQRYLDYAIQLEVHERRGNHHVGTGVKSRVIGGVYDSWSDAYTDDEPSTVLNRPVTCDQFDFCMTLLEAEETGIRRVMGKGGRGGGKTETLAQASECLLLDRLYDNQLGLSPDYPHTELVWECLIERILHWLRPGTQGIHTTKHRLTTLTGQVVKFLSGHVEKIVRGPGAGVGFIDEEKDVPTKVVDTFIPAIRTSAYFPLIFGVGTPEMGTDFEARWIQSGEEPTCKQHSFPSRNNCFIDGEIWDISKTLMSEKRYRQEVLAEFVEIDPIPFIVKRHYDRATHCTDPVEVARDVTRTVTMRKLRRPFSWIAGVDYNPGVFDVAWIHRVYAPNIWVVHDIVKSYGSTSAALAQALKDAGYAPHDTVIIDDASGEYNKNQHGRKSPNSSSRLMREFGYTVHHKRKNPDVLDRINAFMAKVAPVEGPPTWLYERKIAEQVEAVMDVIKTKGTGLDKSDGVDHDFDAATYPVVFFEPPAKLQIPRLRGVMKHG